MRLKLSLVLTLLALTATASEIRSNHESATSALHLDWLDPNIAVGENFYGYANGNWQKQNPIPPEYATWGSFTILQEKTQNQIHQLLINAAQDQKAKTGSLEQKVGDFYFSGMDEEAIEKQGLAPLASEFARINAIKNLADLESLLSHLHLIGVNVLFDFSSMQDFKNSEKMIAAAFQGGLGLPDRDYYLKDSPKFKQIRADYLQHMTKMFELLGDDATKARTQAQTVMAIETALATASMSQTEQRDPHAIYNMMTIEELAKLTPSFSWPQYLQGLGLKDIKTLNLAMPLFFKALNKDLQERNIADWKTYLRWHLIDTYAAYLSKPFVEQDFWMSKALSGTQKLLPRWKRVVNTENAALGFAVGKLYVEEYFSADSKKQVLEILQNIRQVMQKDLETLSWMTPETRQAAIKKLALIEERVGYPSKWRDYSGLIIDRGPYVLNVKRANEFLNHYELNKIGKPIDRSEWAMTPQTINAYYNPSMNNINMPAGILQAPFFDPKAPAAVNYGAIGFVMGHELTHGFDDQGAQFDGLGNLNDWWKPQDLKKFQAATNCIVEQFSQYKVDDDFAVQGKLVVGEATADLGGLTLAYRAFQASKAYKEAKTLAGFTPEQQFFLGTAHVWAGNIRPEQARNLVTTDPHPPMIYRVNGTLANMPQFQLAFSLPDSSPMINKHRCVIW